MTLEISLSLTYTPTHTTCRSIALESQRERVVAMVVLCDVLFSCRLLPVAYEGERWRTLVRTDYECKRKRMRTLYARTHERRHECADSTHAILSSVVSIRGQCVDRTLGARGFLLLAKLLDCWEGHWSLTERHVHFCVNLSHFAAFISLCFSLFVFLSLAIFLSLSLSFSLLRSIIVADVSRAARNAYHVDLTRGFFLFPT